MNELMLKIATLIVLYFLTFGCSEPDVNAIPEHIEDLENLTIYSADTGPNYQIRLEREQVFGDTKEIFIGWLKTMSVDNAGRVYIGDGEELDIKVYQADGNYVGSIGKEGDGPGEFRDIASIKTISDQIVVLDQNRQVIQWFSADSYDLLNSVLMDPGVDDMEVARVADIFVRNDQSMLLQLSKMISRSERIRHYSLMNHSGEITAGNILELRDADIFSFNTNEYPMVMVLPFVRKPLVAVSKTNGMYSSWNRYFLVKKYNLNGEGEYSRAFFYPFKNVELIRSDVLDMYNNEYFRRAVQNVDFPKTWPALNEMLIDDENRLWISTIVEDFDVYEWWILEDTGELITKFEWPRNEPIEVVKNGKMYTRQTDEETGLQQVVRYRVEMEPLR